MRRNKWKIHIPRAFTCICCMRRTKKRGMKFRIMKSGRSISYLVRLGVPLPLQRDRHSRTSAWISSGYSWDRLKNVRPSRKCGLPPPPGGRTAMWKCTENACSLEDISFLSSTSREQIPGHMNSGVASTSRDRIIKLLKLHDLVPWCKRKFRRLHAAAIWILYD